MLYSGPSPKVLHLQLGVFRVSGTLRGSSVFTVFQISHVTDKDADGHV